MSGDRLALLIPPELDAEMTPGVRAFVELLLRRMDALEAEVADLRAELAAVKKTPRNSSLPPSSEHPHAKPVPKKKKSRQKRGGQPGHAKHERPLIPAAECVDVIPCVPTDCRRCGAKLSSRDPEPWRHQVWDVPEIQPLVIEYQQHRHRLWTFVDVEHVEPTNNASERALRHAVIWRKLSFGTQSANGSRFVETLLTVIETCRQQSRSVFTFLTETLAAHFAHQPTPSLAGA